MARPASVPMTRLRFCGRGDTLKTLVNAFREHPKQALTASLLEEYTGLSFQNVYDRLKETPELFSVLPKRPDANTRYRLTLAVERMSAAETQAFIARHTRAEKQMFASVALIFLSLAVLIGYLSWNT